MSLKKQAYVSEFTVFMDRFLAEHPAVVKDQLRGWYIYWDHHVDDVYAQPDELPYVLYA